MKSCSSTLAEGVLWCPLSVLGGLEDAEDVRASGASSCVRKALEITTLNYHHYYTCHFNVILREIC